MTKDSSSAPPPQNDKWAQQHYRVYYEDTDAGGVVYYANYLKFAERARTDALRALGIHQSRLKEEQGLAFVVTRCEIDYHAPARLDDDITIHSAITQLRAASLTMQQRLTLARKPLSSLTVQIAMVDTSGKPARIPRDIAETLRPLLQKESS